jgi:hypothetical protein
VTATPLASHYFVISEEDPLSSTVNGHPRASGDMLKSWDETSILLRWVAARGEIMSVMEKMAPLGDAGIAAAVLL